MSEQIHNADAIAGNNLKSEKVPPPSSEKEPFEDDIKEILARYFAKGGLDDLLMVAHCFIDWKLTSSFLPTMAEIQAKREEPDSLADFYDSKRKILNNGERIFLKKIADKLKEMGRSDLADIFYEKVS